MLKKITKLCLTAAACALVAGQVSAAEVKSEITGRAIGYYQNYSEKIDDNTVTKNDVETDARLGVKLTATEGDYTVGGFVEFDADADSNNDGERRRDMYAFLGTKSFDLQIGRMYKAGITKGGAYFQDVTSLTQYYIGEEGCSYGGCRIDSIYFGLKDLGLYTQIGMNQVATSEVDSTLTGDMDENFYLIGYGKDMGAMSIAAQYSNATTSVNEDRNSAAKDSKADGASITEWGVSGSYKISDKMTVAAGIDSTTKKTGESGADALTDTIVQASFDMGLDETSGISVFVAMKTDEVTKDEDVNMTKFVAGYTKDIAGLKLFANVGQEKGKNDDADVDTDNREIAAGLRYNF